MFLVFKKDKLISYIIVLCTVGVLIIIGATSNLNQTIQTSYIEKEVPVYCTQTNENKVALTMNCAW